MTFLRAMGVSWRWLFPHWVACDRLYWVTWYQQQWMILGLIYWEKWKQLAPPQFFLISGFKSELIISLTGCQINCLKIVGGWPRLDSLIFLAVYPQLGWEVDWCHSQWHQYWVNTNCIFDSWLASPILVSFVLLVALGIL